MPYGLLLPEKSKATHDLERYSGPDTLSLLILCLALAESILGPIAFSFNSLILANLLFLHH